MTARLTREEREIVEAFERDELRSPPNRAATLKKHREYAAATIREDRMPPGRYAPAAARRIRSGRLTNRTATPR